MEPSCADAGCESDSLLGDVYNCHNSLCCSACSSSSAAVTAEHGL